MKRSELSLLLAQSGAAFPDAEARMCFDAWATSPLPPTPDPDSADVGIADTDLLSLAKKRKEGMPIQYLLGRAWFYKECYEVSESCLIPRADTEHLVEYAIKHLPPNAYFADLCTGSGCVAISVLKSRPDCKAIAVDLSKDALEVAKRNAKNLGVKDRLTFLEADALSYIPQTPFDAVLSNPPYIKRDVIPTLDREVQKEPSMALDGGEDGLDFYRAFCKNSSLYIYKGGFMAFEIGYDQREALELLAKENNLQITTYKDYGGLDRLAVLEL